MDINILVALQNFRNGVGGFLAEFLAKMTFFGELNVCIILMAVVYWCISKTYGTYLLMGWSGNRIVNGLLKVTVCAYRPWIRDARIVPYGNAMTTATGYSFPSGHSMNASAVYGGGVVRRDLPGALRVALALLLALVAFSRIYLGVHTPQDILVGVAAGLVMMAFTTRLIRWLEQRPGRDVAVMCAGIAIAAAVAVFAALKSYPEDFDAAGKLLVDGKKMANDTFKGVGWCVGFLAGWVMERRWVGFSTDVPMVTRMSRLVIGLLGYYAVSLILIPLLKAWIPGAAGTVVTCFVQMFYVSFLFPWCIKRLERASAQQPEAAAAAR